jgi:hypothetical protein
VVEEESESDSSDSSSEEEEVVVKKKKPKQRRRVPRLHASLHNEADEEQRREEARMNARDKVKMLDDISKLQARPRHPRRGPCLH